MNAIWIIGIVAAVVGAVLIVGGAIWVERPSQDRMDEEWLRRFRKDHPYD